MTDTTITSTPPASDAPATEEDAAVSAETVVSVIQQSPDHATLARAIEAAELVDALEAEGPFTVFAPTDSAFDALPPGQLDSLLLEENQSQLQALLRHHVVVGELTATNLETRVEEDRSRVETISGDSLTFSMQGGDLMAGDASVSAAGLSASNGLVHVVDAVLLPAESPSGTTAPPMGDPMSDPMEEDDAMEDTTMMQSDTTMQEGAMMESDPVQDDPVQDTTMMENGVVEDESGMEDSGTPQDDMVQTPPPADTAGTGTSMTAPPVTSDDGMMEDDAAMEDDGMMEGDAADAGAMEESADMVPRDTTIMVPVDTTIMVPRDTTIMVPASSSGGSAPSDTTSY